MYVLVQIDQYDVDTEKAVDKISRQLLEHNIITEGYGGEVPIVPVSLFARGVCSCSGPHCTASRYVCIDSVRCNTYHVEQSYHCHDGRYYGSIM